MGVVNLYETAAVLASAAPRPVKAFMHLTTAVTTLSFHPSGAVLAAASSAKQDALRLIHVEARTVIANWPTSQTPCGRVTALAWSRGDAGGHVAVANDKGRVLLYRLLPFAAPVGGAAARRS